MSYYASATITCPSEGCGAVLAPDVVPCPGCGNVIFREQPGTCEECGKEANDMRRGLCIAHALARHGDAAFSANVAYVDANPCGEYRIVNAPSGPRGIRPLKGGAK